MNATGVDIGGTKIAARVVTPEGEILNEVRYPTAASPERLLPAREEVHLRARSPSRDLVEIKMPRWAPSRACWPPLSLPVIPRTGTCSVRRNLL